jgi:hypothetical protein
MSYQKTKPQLNEQKQVLKKYLVVLSRSNKFQILENISQFSGARIQDKNVFGGEIALLVSVSENEEEFLRIIKEADRIVKEEVSID